MSIPKKVLANCSKCGHPIPVTVFQSVNTDYVEDIAEQIISGNLFNAECSNCGFISHLEYNTLYHDMKHMAMVWVIHKESPEYTSQVAQVRSTNLIPYKTTRIVEDMNALREKVACLENNRDDRIIELCKVFTANTIISQRPDFIFKHAFYTTSEETEIIILYDHDGNDIVCKLSDEAYAYLHDLYFESAYVSEFDGNYAIVDYAWAEEIFISLINCNSTGGIKETQNKPSSAMYSANIDKSEEVEPFPEYVTPAKEKKKKKKKIKLIILLTILAFLLALSVKYAFDSAHDDDLRNFATEEMSDDYTNVYADVVSMEPEYYVYTSFDNNISRHISNVICKCQTVEGITIWVSIDIEKYPNGSSTFEQKNHPYYYSESDPLRLVGKVTTAKNVIDTLESKIGDVFVLDVKSLQGTKVQ